MSKPEFVYVIYIETTPEKLWHALTDGDFTQRYWFGARLESEWKVGSPFAMMRDGTVTDTGEVMEFDPPRRLAYTFVLERYGELVKLTLTHEGFDAGSRMLPAISSGWPAILSSLKSMLESGHALGIPFEALRIEEHNRP